MNIDDMGWRDVGFMGSEYYETPNLDALAAEGMKKHKIDFSELVRDRLFALATGSSLSILRMENGEWGMQNGECCSNNTNSFDICCGVVIALLVTWYICWHIG